MAVKQYSFTIYYVGLLLLAAGLPLWMLLMSISQIIILVAFLISGNLAEKFRRAFTNPVVLTLTGVFFLHVVGLIYTEDVDYALRDIRIKLPLLLLPIVFSTMAPLSNQQFNNVLKVLIFAAFAGTMCSMAAFFGLIKIQIANVRDISLFISHIRFALIICVAIVSIVYLLYQNDGGKMMYIYVPLIIWFVLFLVILESLTGIAILSVLLVVSCFFLAWKSKARVIRILTGICLISTLMAGYALFQYLFIESVIKIDFTTVELKKFTAAGNSYNHFTNKQDLENGKPVWVNICEVELDSAWNSRSKLNYNGHDLLNQEIKFTLIRYLASKNYRKDAEGVSRLSLEDINAIENGISNVNYLHKSDLRARLQQLAWEYRNYYFSGNPSGHSAMQRLEFWKTAIYIIKEHPYIGVGTGDIPLAFKKAYIDRKSKLLPEYRYRSHNEYLSMAVAFGIFGGIYFIFSLLFPFIYMRKRSDLLYMAFFFILMLSMLTEDTPETQAGATFMAFLNSFLLFRKSEKPFVS